MGGPLLHLNLEELLLSHLILKTLETHKILKETLQIKAKLGDCFEWVL